jgi:hypothetical protein
MADRILGSLELREPEELRVARQKAQSHPRSAAPAAALGDQQYRCGLAREALLSYDHALALAPDLTRAHVGRLRTLADYGLVGAAEAARKALRALPDDPRVVAAAADALAAGGAEEEGRQALDGAWVAHPGDLELARARLRWGLSGPVGE